MPRFVSTGPSRVLLLLILTLALTAPQIASADKPRTGCPPGFDVGALTFEESLALPRIQSGLLDGFYTLDQLEAGFASFDKNGDGEICFQESLGSSKANPASGWQYLYNVVDNNSSKP